MMDLNGNEIKFFILHSIGLVGLGLFSKHKLLIIALQINVRNENTQTRGWSEGRGIERKRDRHTRDLNNM